MIIAAKSQQSHTPPALVALAAFASLTEPSTPGLDSRAADMTERLRRVLTAHDLASIGKRPTSRPWGRNQLDAVGLAAAPVDAPAGDVEAAVVHLLNGNDAATNLHHELLTQFYAVGVR